MAVIEFARYTIDPARAEDLVERWRAAVPAIRGRFPGLHEATLTRLDDTTWMDVWTWDSREHAEAADQHAPDVPEAAAMFSLITAPPLMEHGEIVEQG